MISPQMVTQVLATLVLASNISLVVGLFVFLFVTGGKLSKLAKVPIFFAIGKNARILSLIVALVSMLGSLYFSDIALYAPCKLCWYQRIAMYPMVLLLGIAIAKEDKKNIIDYCLGLSGIGAIIATYHYYLQRGGNEFIPCTTVGYSVNCSEFFTMSYGYITIPFMALTAFLMIFCAMMLYRASQTSK